MFQVLTVILDSQLEKLESCVGSWFLGWPISRTVNNRTCIGNICQLSFLKLKSPFTRYVCDCEWKLKPNIYPSSFPSLKLSWSKWGTIEENIYPYTDTAKLSIIEPWFNRNYLSIPNFLNNLKQSFITILKHLVVQLWLKPKYEIGFRLTLHCWKCRKNSIPISEIQYHKHFDE